MNDNLDTYSTEDLKAELKNRKKYPKNIAIGYLKTDMRYLSSGYNGGGCLEFSGWFMSEKRFKGEIDKFVASTDIIPKGTKFVKIQFDHADEGTWFDDIKYGIEDMDEAWAKKNLENIEEVTNG